MASYPSSMTDSEWKILETLLPPKPDTFRGRPQEHSRRSIIDGIFYIIRTGGAWRMMPNDLPHWKACYTAAHQDLWKRDLSPDAPEPYHAWLKQ